MPETREFTLQLPRSGSPAQLYADIGFVTERVTIRSGQSIIIIGANGSGKTRLGVWISSVVIYGGDGQIRRNFHHVAAQKSLEMPSIFGIASLESPGQQLFAGMNHQKSPIILQNDFIHLMTFLFSEDASTSINHRILQKENDFLLPVPKTRLDIIKVLWELIFPHRELEISLGKVQTRIKDGITPLYSASEMSDGERVAFYLIGQALSAPQDGIIIIDEPELHLHKSIQTRLWREIQAARPDCLFVYMTHDVEFAASLTEAKKIWLKSYNGTVWEWEEVPNVPDFPEDLLLQILGSRQSVLFVEGDEGSYDVDLFRVLYPEHLVIPRASCNQVILATKALREAKAQIHKEAFGIIDRDRRLPGEIEKLKAQGVRVLDVAEVENLFCVPEVLIWVAQHLGFPSPQDKLGEAENLAFEMLSRELDKQISQHVGEEIARQLKQFEISKQGLSALQMNFDSCVNGIDVNAIYAQKETEFKTILANRNYREVLRLLNHKGLAAELKKVFGGTQIPELVTRLANGGKQQELRQALSSHIPTF